MYKILKNAGPKIIEVQIHIQIQIINPELDWN